MERLVRISRPLLTRSPPWGLHPPPLWLPLPQPAKHQQPSDLPAHTYVPASGAEGTLCPGNGSSAAFSRKYLWNEAPIFRTCYSQKFPEKAPGGMLRSHFRMQWGRRTRRGRPSRAATILDTKGPLCHLRGLEWPEPGPGLFPFCFQKLGCFGRGPSPGALGLVTKFRRALEKRDMAVFSHGELCRIPMLTWSKSRGLATWLVFTTVAEILFATL